MWKHHSQSPVCICAVSRWKPSSARIKLIHAISKCYHLLPEDVKCVTVTFFFYCAGTMQILSLRALNTWKLSWAKWQLAKLLECNTPGSDWIKKGFSYNSLWRNSSHRHFHLRLCVQSVLPSEHETEAVSSEWRSAFPEWGTHFASFVSPTSQEC